MTWMSFLYAADALMKEEGLSFHVETADGAPERPAPTPADNRARNQQAMQQFQAMMGGVQKKKGRRR
jgi:hypothetical protein